MEFDLHQISARWAKRSLYIALAAAVPVTAIAAVLNQVYFTLAVAVPLLLVTHAYVLTEIGQLKKQARETDKIYDAIKHFGQYNAKVYRHESDFYTDLRASVAKARESVWVSYLRPFRRSASRAELEKHLRGCFDWAERDPDRAFRRIMSTSTADEVIAPDGERFGEQQLRFMHEADRGGFNYRVRIVDWTPQHYTDSYSMSLIDDEEFYFIVSGRDDEFWAFYVSSKDLSSGGLRDRYNNLWTDAHWLTDHFDSACTCTAAAIPRPRAPEPEEPPRRGRFRRGDKRNGNGTDNGT